MKIAITYPTGFERIRRGTERFMHELAVYMADRGHEVQVISCKPGRRERVRVGNYLRNVHRRWWHPAMGRLGVLESHAFLVTSFLEMVKQRFDVIQCCSFTDAYAARLARRFTGVPYAFFVNSIPPKVKYFRAASLGGGVLRRAVLGADELIPISEYARSYCQARFGRGGVALPVPVDTRFFKLCTQRDHDHPVLLCAADLGDKRKGGEVLMRAFNLIKRERPGVRLEVCSPTAGLVAERLLGLVEPKWRADAVFVGVGRPEDLPAVYGRAAVSVLPSLWEAFGMVVIESMATGTPVVGARDGALIETISTPDVGRLFEPQVNEDSVAPNNPEGLARAVIETLDLSRNPETARRCREHAQKYSWDAIGPKYEAIYERLIAQRRPAGKVA